MMRSTTCTESSVIMNWSPGWVLPPSTYPLLPFPLSFVLTLGFEEVEEELEEEFAGEEEKASRTVRRVEVPVSGVQLYVPV